MNLSIAGRRRRSCRRWSATRLGVASLGRGALLGVLLFGVGCLPVHENVRVERGALLRSETRSTVLPGGARARAEAAWPQLRLQVQSFDRCRSEIVETYEETKTTEYSSPAAGPAFWVGTTALLGGAALFGASYLLSDEPSRDDLGGIGPSDRQVSRGIGLGALIVGAPAATLGIAAMARVGERVEAQTADQVASQRDEPCGGRPVAGALELRAVDGRVVARVAAVNGAATLTATEVSGTVEQLLLEGQPVEIDEASFSALDAFGACQERESWPSVELASLGTEVLLSRAQVLHRCRRIRGAPVADEFSAIDRELRRRQAPVEASPGAAAPAPSPGGLELAGADWEQIVAKLGAPIQLGAADLRTWSGEAARRLAGRLVFAAGRLGPGPDAASRRLDVGGGQLLVDLSQAVVLGTDAADGARVELLGLVEPSDGAGSAPAPIRALFVRAAP